MFVSLLSHNIALNPFFSWL